MVASDETIIRNIGIESGVKAEFIYPNYKNYVDIQKVDGSWDESILEVCDKTEEEVIKNFPKKVKRVGDKNQQLKIMYTWIGINRLRTQFKDKEEEWKLIVQKAEEYLSKESSLDGKYEDIDSKLFEEEDRQVQEEEAEKAKKAAEAAAKASNIEGTGNQLTTNDPLQDKGNAPIQKHPGEGVDDAASAETEESPKKKKKGFFKKMFCKIFKKKK